MRGKVASRFTRDVGVVKEDGPDILARRTYALLPVFECLETLPMSW